MVIVIYNSITLLTDNVWKLKIWFIVQFLFRVSDFITVDYIGIFLVAIAVALGENKNLARGFVRIQEVWTCENWRWVFHFNSDINSVVE